MSEPTDVQLLGYLDEALPVEEMARIEQALRASEPLRRRAAAVARRRDHGAHELGEIWRRRRLSCPSRIRLGGLLLGTLDPAYADYLRFHLDVVGCRWCQANLDDLQARLDESQTTARRQRFFQSSAGRLPRDE